MNRMQVKTKSQNQNLIGGQAFCRIVTSTIGTSTVSPTPSMQRLDVSTLLHTNDYR